MPPRLFGLPGERVQKTEPPADLRVLGIELTGAAQVDEGLAELVQLEMRDAEPLERAQVLGLGVDDIPVLKDGFAVLLLVEEPVGTIHPAGRPGLGGAAAGGHDDQDSEQTETSAPARSSHLSAFRSSITLAARAGGRGRNGTKRK